MADTRFIDPATLARIGNLELIARWVVEGFMSGLHRSPHLGFSTDFAEHRAYAPGDDIRRIDWRVYARTERFYLKQFEADTNTNLTVLLDTSASMGYAHSGITKLEYAKYLAASLVYFSQRQRDRVGLVTFSDRVREVVPPSAKHVPHILHALQRATADGRSGLGRALAQVAEQQRKRGIFVLISDLYEDASEVVAAVGPLRDAGHDVIVMQVLDAAERTFPFEDAATFRDLETGERVPVVPGRLRERYVTAMAAHIASMRRRLREHRVDYALVDTSQPLDRVLFDYLLQRDLLRTAI